MSVDSLPPVIQSAFEHKRLPRTNYGIAFIGCGGIVNSAHIPAYEAHGFDGIGGYDINLEAVTSTVQEHGLKKGYETLDDVLLDSMVRMVDIAVLAWEQNFSIAIE